MSDTKGTPGTVIQVQSDVVNKPEAVSDTDVTPGTVIQIQRDVVNKPETVSDTDWTQIKDWSKSVVAEVNQEDTSESDHEAPCGLF